MIYFLKATNGLIKIGYTGHANVSKRVEKILPYSPVPLELIGYHSGSRNVERFLHSVFRKSHNEWYFPDNRLLQYIKRHAKTPAKLPKLSKVNQNS